MGSESVSPDQINILVGFGYLSRQDVPYTDAELKEATKLLQDNYHRPITGEWDQVLTNLVNNTPRCGCSDAQHASSSMVQWGQLDLTYFIESRVSGVGITDADFDAIIRDAYNGIEAVCGIHYERVNTPQEANLIITTGRGKRAGFDGPQGTLAYAYLPPDSAYLGQLQLYLDLDERWSADGRQSGTIGLLQVFSHESCHNLGLDHTNVQNSLMNPFYNQGIARPQADERKKLTSRYQGARPRPGTVPPVVPPPVVPTVPPVVPGVPVPSITSLEFILRVNGNQTFGPYQLDPRKHNLELPGFAE